MRIAFYVLALGASACAMHCGSSSQAPSHASSSSGGSSSGGSSGGSGSSSGGAQVGPVVCMGKSAPTGAVPALTPGMWVNVSPPGVPFAIADGNPNQVFPLGLDVDPCNPSTVYVAISGFNTQSFATIPGGIYKTTDGGSTWKQVSNLDQPLEVRVDPKNSNHLYACDGVRGNTAGFWVSHDGGNTWAIPQGFTDAVKASANGDNDVYHVEPDPSDFNHVLLTFHWYWDGCNNGCNSGILETFDGGDTWTAHQPNPGWAMAGGYGVFFLYDPASGTGDNKTWLYSTQGKGYWRTTDAGQNWTQVTTNDSVHGVAQIHYAKSGLYAGGTPHLMRSNDNGATWTTVGLQNNGAFAGLTSDGTNLYSGYYLGAGPIIVTPETDGTNWSNFNGQSFNSGPYRIVFNPIDRILYASITGSGVWALKVN